MVKRRGYRRRLAGLAWERLDPSFIRQPKLVALIAAPRPREDLRALVGRLAGYGFSVNEISRLAGIRPATITRHFREEISTSALRYDAEVIESAFLQANGGPLGQRNFRHADASMTRFWLGQRRGWRQPLASDPARKLDLDLDRLSDEELDELNRLFEVAGDAGPGEGGA